MVLMLTAGTTYFYRRDSQERLVFLYLRDVKKNGDEEDGNAEQAQKIDLQKAFAAHRGLLLIHIALYYEIMKGLH
jgi:hypothetical protein